MTPRGSPACRVPVPGIIRAILENPIALREWRSLRRRALDWRIWIGVKWTLDPTVWGAPVVVTYAVAPYALWMVLGTLRGLKVIPKEQLPIDPFLMLLIVFGVYVVAICQVLGATAVTQEREQQTWEQLWLTLLSGRERAAGFYWGRMGPVVVALLATTGFWWLLQPHYAALLKPFWPGVVPRVLLALAGLMILLLSLLAGLAGLLASALSRQTLVAVVCSSIALWHAFWIGFSVLPLVFAAAYAFWLRGGASGTLAGGVIGLLGVGLVVLCLWGLWEGLASALTRHPVPVRYYSPDAGRKALDTGHHRSGAQHPYPSEQQETVHDEVRHL
jgi:hypothetical protein